MPACAYGGTAYLRICVGHGGREGELRAACGMWVRCSQAGSGRRSVGDGVAEAEKVGQEGKKAAGGGDVPCGGAATGQHLLESYLRPWLRTLSISVAAAELDLALPARWASPMARRGRYVRAAPLLRLEGLRVGADAEVSLLGRRIHTDASAAAGLG